MCSVSELSLNHNITVQYVCLLQVLPPTCLPPPTLTILLAASHQYALPLPPSVPYTYFIPPLPTYVLYPPPTPHIPSSHTHTHTLATPFPPSNPDSSSPQPPQLIAELTHPAQLFPGLRPPQDKVESLAVGDFLSLATTTSGKTYWW